MFGRKVVKEIYWKPPDGSIYYRVHTEREIAEKYQDDGTESFFLEYERNEKKLERGEYLVIFSWEFLSRKSILAFDRFVVP